MPIKIKPATGAGSVSLEAQNAISSDFTLTLPGVDGTVNTSGAVNQVPAGSVSAPSIFPTGDTNTGIYFPAADTIAFAEGGVESARIDSSGNLLVGTTSAISTNASPALVSFLGANKTNSNEVGILTIASSDSYAQDKGGSIGFVYKYNTAGGYATGARIYGAKENSTDGNWNGYIGFATAAGGSPVERARIDSSGNLLVGTTDSGETTGVGFKSIVSTTAPTYKMVVNSATGNASFIVCYNTNATNNGYRAYIKYDGGLANFSANNINLSDERLKTQINPAGDYLDKICSIPVKTYLYKDQGDSELNLGVIAQDVLAVAPELVDKDGWAEKAPDGSDYLSIYQTDLQYALMKCIQELSAKLDAAEARIAALEAK